MSSLLRFGLDTPECDLRTAIVEAGQIAYTQGLLCASDGNLSIRLPDGNILITPSGVGKGRLSPEDLLVIDPDGRMLKPAADASLRATSELPMHLEVYRRRPDVRAVLHAHPPYATALTAVYDHFRLDILPEMAALLGDIPITELAMPSSGETAAVIHDLIITHDALMIRQHGSLTVGKNLEEALIHLERLEYIARVILIAETAAGANPAGNGLRALPPEMLARLESMHRQLQASR